MAVLTAIAIVMALIADFLLLPVLLLKLDKKAYKTEEENASNDSNTRFTAAN